MNKKINYIHERALRLVYNDYNSCFECLLNKDKSVCIHHRNIQKVAMEMFKVKNGSCTDSLHGLFHQMTSKTRANAEFLKPNVNSVYYGEQTLRSFGPIVWDTMIPSSLKEISNFEAFKSEIIKWVPTNCPCRLCKVYIPKRGYVTLYE